MDPELINGYQFGIWEILANNLTGVGKPAGVVVDYRTAPTELSPLVMVTNWRNKHASSVTGIPDSDGYFDFLVVMAVRFEPQDAASQRNAERKMNTMEMIIVNELPKPAHRQTYGWSKLSFPEPATRPSPPEDFIHWRWGIITVRIKPK